MMNLRNENAWEESFQTAIKAKEKDLRSIPDRKSGRMRRFLLDDLRDLGRT